jgi:YesN/AraC family two-component response regulator
MGKKYVIAFVRMSGFTKLIGRFTEGDEGLVTFLAVNIAEELLLSSEFEVDVVNFHDLSLGVLFSFPDDMPVPVIEEKVIELCEELSGSINDICKLNVSIGVSRVAESLKSVHRIFEETKESLSFRNLQEDNQIIEMKKLDTLQSSHTNYEYPFDLEKEIMHAIRQRNQEEAIRRLHEFFAVSTGQNVSEAMIRQGAFKLYSGIFDIVLQSGLLEEFLNEGANPYEKLHKLNNPEEIMQWFEHRVILPIVEWLSRKQDQRLQLVVHKVMHILESKYMDELSLESCADEVGLNPSFLSKIFKDISGWNFIDYLTHIRLTKAKELLVDTDAKIMEIAEQTGYNSSYFNRIFRKHEGITPSEYREMHRKTPGS